MRYKNNNKVQRLSNIKISGDRFNLNNYFFTYSVLYEYY